MEDAERKMRRRAYMRGMMKIYRDEFKKEMAYLRGKEFQLLREIHKLIQEKQQQLGKVNDTLTVLPWKEVALALKRDADEASESLDKLREEVSEHQRLIRDMERWIQSQLKIPTIPSTTMFTWRNTTLFADPTSRQLAKTWITKQIYHNADRVFQKYKYPTMDNPCDLYDFDIVASPGGVIEYIHRRQFDVNLSARTLLSMWQLLSPDALFLTAVSEDSDATKLHTMHFPHDEVVHLLTGMFESETRSIFVGQEILQDDLLPKDGLKQRSRMLWYEVVPLATNKSRVRGLYIFTQFITHEGGPFPFEDEASRWGFDGSLYPENLKHQKFRQHVMTLASQKHIVSRNLVNQYLSTQVLSEYG
ncbi:hypothetical protein AeNC1_011131 [Aphanomyces euteiches]|nr:hypothetical protein AeNC1_011131 [Aphanomyces euteiches]